MAITTTTLTAAINNLVTTIPVASATGITAPTLATGIGITQLQIDAEYLLVNTVNGLVIGVTRGFAGTQSASHLTGSQVRIGAPTDYPPFIRILGSEMATAATFAGLNLPSIFLAGSADVISPTLQASYLIKTAGVDAATLAAPTANEEGNVIMIYSDTANAHTVTATALFANGTALKTTATYAAFRGAGMTLRANNLVWAVIAQNNVVFT